MSPAEPTASTASTAPTAPTEIEVADHLWKVWQYRHSFFWGAVVRWGVAVVITSVIPHVRPQFLLVGGWVLLFPLSAVLLTFVSFFHLLGEHQRLVAATEVYLKYAEPHVPQQPEFASRLRNPTYSFVTGRGVIMAYLVALLLLSTVNAIYLTNPIARKAADAATSVKK